MIPVRVAYGQEERSLAELPVPLDLDRLVPGSGRWEVEVGFGKGRYLLQRALAEGEAVRFLGVELVSKYYRLLRDRARKRGLRNLLLCRGEALYLISVALPAGFAAAVHVYFPDPWPKGRHRKRRLFDAESVDLVLGLLAPAGRLFFATDDLEYGGAVREILASHGGLRVRGRDRLWEGGARTHYEAKYEAEGRPIVRLEAALREAGGAGLHPLGAAGVLAAVRPRGSAVGE